MHIYRVTVLTDEPQRECLQILQEQFFKFGLDEFVLEDHKLESEDEIEFEAIKWFVNSLPGKTTLSSWDKIQL